MNIIKYSTNPRITGDKSKAEAARFVKGWELRTVDWNESKLRNVAQTECYIASKLKTGYKHKDDVIECYFIPLDFDAGDLTIKQFKKKAARWQFSWFLHTTSSHQQETTGKDGETIPAIDKFRVWIPLSRPISRSELQGMEEYWVSLFPSIDKSCFQAERYFYLSKDAETDMKIFVDELGEVVYADPDKILEKTTYHDVRKKKQSASGRGRPKKDLNTFSNNDPIKLADGTERFIKDITAHTPIFCPFCIHDKEHRGNPDIANAFIDFNELGNKYISCSSEHKTYWQAADEVLTGKHVLFIYEETGMPAVIETERIKKKFGYVNILNVHSFKNLHTDFTNWCIKRKINPESRVYLDRMGVTFDPGQPAGYLKKEGKFNLFQPSEYYLKDYSKADKIKLGKETVDFLKEHCPYTFKILTNIFGDDTYLLHFINWLATLWQSEEKKLETGWLIISEKKGIGKDFLFLHILEPLFGPAHTQMLEAARMSDRFNILDELCWLRGFNEVFLPGDMKRNLAVRESLKARITAATHVIERKGIDVKMRESFINFILFSNSNHAILLEHGDRRFNVIENVWAKQVLFEPWFKGNTHLEGNVKKELDKLAELFHRLDYDINVARTALDTKAKKDLETLSLTEPELFAKALRDGDADYFLLDEVFTKRVMETLEAPDEFGSSISLYVEKYIKEYSAIPSKYMSPIVKLLFTTRNYKSILRILKFAGVDNGIIRDKALGKTVRVYKFKEVDPEPLKNQKIPETIEQ